MIYASPCFWSRRTASAPPGTVPSSSIACVIHLPGVTAASPPAFSTFLHLLMALFAHFILPLVKIVKNLAVSFNVLLAALPAVDLDGVGQTATGDTVVKIQVIPVVPASKVVHMTTSALKVGLPPMADLA